MIHNDEFPDKINVSGWGSWKKLHEPSAGPNDVLYKMERGDMSLGIGLRFGIGIGLTLQYGTENPYTETIQVAVGDSTVFHRRTEFTDPDGRQRKVDGVTPEIDKLPLANLLGRFPREFQEYMGPLYAKLRVPEKGEI